MAHNFFIKAFRLGCCYCWGISIAIANETPFTVHGKAWNDFGRIQKVSDTLVAPASDGITLNLTGNALHGMGGQFLISSDLSDNMEGVFGFGAQKATHALGKGQNALMAISLFESFLMESYVKLYTGEKESPNLSLTVGSFSHKYNEHAHNLGLYLLRGPVYPGILMGGFQDPYTDPTRGTLLGLKAHQAMGGFSHDLILNSERDIPPTFDWSLAYMAQYDFGETFKIGAGINFYRGVGIDFLDKYMVQNEDLLTPGKMSLVNLNYNKSPYVEIGDSIGVDTTGAVVYDTTFFTHQGIKLNSYFALDLKSLLGYEYSQRDLVLYGELAVIGVKDYGTVYGNINERIPVMFGFNLPTFGFLNLLSFEVEWYGAKYRNDLALVGNNNAVAPWTIKNNYPIPSPKPTGYEDYGISPEGMLDSSSVLGTELDVENLTTDNWKWSLYMEKVFAEHIGFVLQIASDHYRPRPVVTNPIASAGGTATAFSSPSDWYWMFRTHYFF